MKQLMSFIAVVIVAVFSLAYFSQTANAGSPISLTSESVSGTSVTVYFNLNGAPQAQDELEIASDVSFSTIVYNATNLASGTTVNNLPTGQLYWRMKDHSSTPAVISSPTSRAFTIF